MGYDPKQRSGLNNALKWLWDLLSLYSSEQITVPLQFDHQMSEIKKLMVSDTSGMVNSLLDFSINTAIVEFSILTSNASLTEKLNRWIKNINASLRGRVPTGIKALAKENFKERWKGGSFLLLRTQWEEVDGLQLPTKLWFLDGSNIKVEDGVNDVRVIGEERYSLKIKENQFKPLPAAKNELIFVQRPFSNWNSLYPVPFIIQRGLYKNLKLLELLNSKSEMIIGKALEYMFLMKKGTEALAKEGRPEFIYSEEDLKKVKTDFNKFASDRKTTSGIPAFATNFDTEIEHIIPDYQRAISTAIYGPIEKRLLAGMGLIEIIEGTTSNRKESLLNPKPFIAEVTQGIEDFRALLSDIVMTIVEKNKESHPKYFGSKIEVYSSPVKEFLTDNIRDHIRSMFDRGVISIETYSDICGEEVHFDIEKLKRQRELDEGLEYLFYPHITQNLEKDIDIRPNLDNDDYPDDEDLPSDKRGIERKNYKGMDQGAYEEAPYKTNKDLPDQVKVLPAAAQSLWRNVFNKSFPKGEDYARKVAWSVVKKIYKKSGNKWVRKSKGTTEKAIQDLDIDELINIKKLEIMGKQNKILDKLITANKE